MNFLLYKIKNRFAPSIFTFLMGFLPTLFGISLFITLGCWQVQRAESKRQLLASYETNSQAPHLSLADLKNVSSPTDMHYRQIELNGVFEIKRQFLLDNRFYNHHLGYHVITPLAIPGHTTRFLIDRGWIPQTDQRTHLPVFKTRETQTKVIGFIDFPPKKNFILNQREDNPNTWPRIIETLDLKKIEAILGEPIYPFVIKLHPSAANGFVRNWSEVTTMPPARHLAYAFQWFALAVTVFVIYLFLMLRRKNEY